ncbi:ABC transporter ATP-binding protein [Candidatus Saccharibacteria bacterium]|nr:ABC transporter ATP-binding protein [Candidatus Saccharibacteria bacterium]
MNKTLKIFGFYWRHAWEYPRYVVPIMAFIPVTVFVNSYLPPLILAVVLKRLSQHDFVTGQVWDAFGWLLVGYAILMVCGGLLWRLVDFFAWRLEANVLRSMAQRVFAHLTRQSANFHANSFVGSLVSQNSKLLGAYIRIADTSMFMVIPLIWGIVFTIAIMLPRAPLYSVLLLVFTLLYIASTFFVTRPTRRLSAKHATAESAQTGVLADALTNVMAIKSFAREPEEKRRFAKSTDETHDRLLTLGRRSQRQMAYFSSTTGVLEAIALIIAVLAVVSHGADIATAFLIFSYTSTIVNQLFSFSNNALRTYNRAIGDASDMVSILDIVPQVQDPAKPEKSRLKNGTISFNNVTFTHSGADDAIFENLNLHIADGEKVGLVGHSGSGKSTFTRLLLRFSDIDGGTVTISGQNIAKIAQADLHKAITYVPQEPLLFHRSIRENIGYGDPSASDKAVQRAAEQAHAAEFIDLLPQGYDTLVGERGVKLSGGQRQRVAIARAMIKDAPILVLDEATSSLDSESEALIQDALWKLMEGKTAIVIAHRLSTIQHMDRIVVMDDGRIIEEGSHQQLLRKKGAYAKLWARQSGGFIED